MNSFNSLNPEPLLLGSREPVELATKLPFKEKRVSFSF